MLKKIEAIRKHTATGRALFNDLQYSDSKPVFPEVEKKNKNRKKWQRVILSFLGIGGVVIGGELASQVYTSQQGTNYLPVFPYTNPLDLRELQQLFTGDSERVFYQRLYEWSERVKSDIPPELSPEEVGLIQSYVNIYVDQIISFYSEVTQRGVYPLAWPPALMQALSSGRIPNTEELAQFLGAPNENTRAHLFQQRTLANAFFTVVDAQEASTQLSNIGLRGDRSLRFGPHFVSQIATRAENNFRNFDTAYPHFLERLSLAAGEEEARIYPLIDALLYENGYNYQTVFDFLNLLFLDAQGLENRFHDTNLRMDMRVMAAFFLSLPDGSGFSERFHIFERWNEEMEVYRLYVPSNAPELMETFETFIENFSGQFEDISPGLMSFLVVQLNRHPELSQQFKEVYVWFQEHPEVNSAQVVKLMSNNWIIVINLLSTGSLNEIHLLSQTHPEYTFETLMDFYLNCHYTSTTLGQLPNAEWIEGIVETYSQQADRFGIPADDLLDAEQLFTQEEITNLAERYARFSQSSGNTNISAAVIGSERIGLPAEALANDNWPGVEAMLDEFDQQLSGDTDLLSTTVNLYFSSLHGNPQTMRVAIPPAGEEGREERQRQAAGYIQFAQRYQHTLNVLFNPDKTRREQRQILDALNEPFSNFEAYFLSVSQS